jgi:carbamoyl-phosphate synthase large subunit
VRDSLPPSLPCIIKDRFGAGGKGLAVVDTATVLLHARTQAGGIWQELLRPAEQEYTCGLYRTARGETRTIVFRRRLAGGRTAYGRVVAGHADIERLLLRIADLLELRGSINVQLMLTDRGPVVFEINPRFSSTIVFRHRLGFEDVVWSILEQRGEALPAYAPPPDGTAFYRGAEELLLPVETVR